MNETNEVWRGVRAGRRRYLDEQEPKRWDRLRALVREGEVIQLRTLGEHGVRLLHYDRPQSEYVDFWPRTSVFVTHDGRRGKGWVRLLRALGVNRG